LAIYRSNEPQYGDAAASTEAGGAITDLPGQLAEWLSEDIGEHEQCCLHRGPPCGCNTDITSGTCDDGDFSFAPWSSSFDRPRSMSPRLLVSVEIGVKRR
jgi:hypothetical protein